MTLPIFETVLGGLTVTGSIVGTHGDLEEVFALHTRGKTTVERSECALEDVNDAIEAVLDGSAGTARTVLRMAPTAPAARDERAPALASA
jgi:propanol-preferring alcohol dehydrogenase